MYRYLAQLKCDGAVFVQRTIVGFSRRGAISAGQLQ
jgi:hypothetical protein